MTTEGEAGGTFDRDALLDMLRDALGQHRLDGSVAVGALADRVVALVRPVAGDTLSPEAVRHPTSSKE